MSGDTYPIRELSAALGRVTQTAGRGERCPAPDRLWDSAREQLSRTDDQAVVLHLAECSACAAAWRLARDLAGASVVPETFAERPRERRWNWTPLAAAAALLVAIAGGGIYLLSQRPGAAPAYRAQQEDWLQPAAGMEAPLPRERFVLRWTPGPEGSTYDLRVTTERLALLARVQRLDRAAFQVPSESLRDVASGGRVLWQVTAHLPDGRRTDSQTFIALLE